MWISSQDFMIYVVVQPQVPKTDLGSAHCMGAPQVDIPKVLLGQPETVIHSHTVSAELSSKGHIVPQQCQLRLPGFLGLETQTQMQQLQNQH